jgi:hypothetical protein
VDLLAQAAAETAHTVAVSAPPGAGPQDLEASDDGDDRYGVEHLDWGGNPAPTEELGL